MEAPHLFTWKMGIIISATLNGGVIQKVLYKDHKCLLLFLVGWVAFSHIITEHCPRDEIGNIRVAL